jgi:hypothetical protein
MKCFYYNITSGCCSKWRYNLSHLASQRVRHVADGKREGAGIRAHAFLNSELDGSKLSASPRGRFTPRRNNPCHSFNWGLGELHSRAGGSEELVMRWLGSFTGRATVLR